MDEERISELNDIAIETPKTEKEGKKGRGPKKNKQNIQELWDTYKRCNISMVGIPEGEKRKEQKKYLKQ